MKNNKQSKFEKALEDLDKAIQKIQKTKRENNDLEGLIKENEKIIEDINRIIEKNEK